MRTFTARHALPATLAAAAACLGLAPAAHAVAYVETGDAGQTLATAQTVAGMGIDSIRGSLLTTSATDRADLFAISLTAGQAFSATTTASTLAFNNFDTTLFLFGSTGLGLAASDDDGGPQSTINYAVASSGTYYLAIAGAGYNPISAGGSIFPALSSGGQFGPTGPGGAQPLSGWNSTTSEGDLYEIKLAVPEPATAWTLLAGLAVFGVRLARRSA